MYNSMMGPILELKKGTLEVRKASIELDVVEEVGRFQVSEIRHQAKMAERTHIREEIDFLEYCQSKGLDKKEELAQAIARLATL